MTRQIIWIAQALVLMVGSLTMLCLLRRLIQWFRDWYQYDCAIEELQRQLSFVDRGFTWKQAKKLYKAKLQAEREQYLSMESETV